MKNLVIAIMLGLFLSACASSSQIDEAWADDSLDSDIITDTASDDAIVSEKSKSTLGSSDINAVSAQISRVEGLIVDTKARMARYETLNTTESRKLNESAAKELSNYETERAQLLDHRENLELSEGLE